MYQLTETEWIWRDGEFVRWADARIHVMSHSVQYGSSVFEGVRCYETKRGPAIFRLTEHLQRMLGSCKIYRMDLKYSIEDLTAACIELVGKNKLQSCYLRPMVIRGYGAASMVPFASPLEVYIPCWPWGAYLGDGALQNGVDVCVSSWNRVAPNTLPSMAKMAGNYLGGMLVKMEAMADGYAEAIALDPDGMVGEGSGQNLFLIRDGTLYTAPFGSILHGITRDTVINIARDAGIPVEIQRFPREMVYLADELFFCGTASEITPVRSVDKITVGSGKPGPITLDLQRRFMDLVHGRSPDPRGWLTYCSRESGVGSRERQAVTA